MFYVAEQMPRGDFLGSLEQIVMVAVLLLVSDAYGMTVRREFEERTGRESSIGAVYATLERLEQKGLLSSRLGAGTPVRAGRRRRYYRVQPEGMRALDDARRTVNNIWRGLKWPVVKARWSV